MLGFFHTISHGYDELFWICTAMPLHRLHTQCSYSILHKQLYFMRWTYWRIFCNQIRSDSLALQWRTPYPSCCWCPLVQKQTFQMPGISAFLRQPWAPTPTSRTLAQITDRPRGYGVYGDFVEFPGEYGNNSALKILRMRHFSFRVYTSTNSTTMTNTKLKIIKRVKFWSSFPMHLDIVTFVNWREDKVVSFVAIIIIPLPSLY